MTSGFHVHGPHDHELEHAAQHGDDPMAGQLAVVTAILATVGAMFSYMGGATQASAALAKNDAAIRKTEASDAWNYYQSKNIKQMLSEMAIDIVPQERREKVAKEIERECLQHAMTTILPMGGPSSEANRKDLTENLTDCDVLLFIYGDTTQDWIRSQLRFFSKIKPKRESDPKLLAICSGPPPKPDIGINFRLRRWTAANRQ